MYIITHFCANKLLLNILFRYSLIIYLSQEFCYFFKSFVDFYQCFLLFIFLSEQFFILILYVKYKYIRTVTVRKT